jgi:nicotinic acid mononucleotide adenylyltransferase
LNDIGQDNIFRFLGWQEWAALIIRVWLVVSPDLSS